MKNIYLNKSINNKLKFIAVIAIILIGNVFTTNAQVKVGFTQRTSQYTPTKKVYNVKGDFTMLGNTCLTPQNYTATVNNNDSQMIYVDTDNDPTTINSSSSTLALSTENGAVPSCSNIIYAGLYWTGKSSANGTFSVTKDVANGSQAINNDLTIVHNQNIANTNYSLSVTRGGSTNNRYPIYTFTGNGNTYAFTFFNSGASNRVTLSVNGATSVNVPAGINGSGTDATLTTPYTITDGTVSLKILKLIRNAGLNLDAATTQSGASANVNVSGTITTFTSLTKNLNKRVISLKGPTSSSYTQFTASTNDIYYPSGTEDDIFSAYKEITDYVRQNGIGEYFAADMALLEGNPGGTGYSGGWGIIVVYENSKMKYRDVTIFDGYAYVKSDNTSGFTLPVAGFNTVQSGAVGVKLGLMASEGDVNYIGDYFQIQKNSDASYLSLSHSGNSTTNFFNSSIIAGGPRNPSLVNNTGIDISMINVPNPSNTVIGNSQTSTNFKYGTNGDTYSIFAIAMAVDAYIPEVENILTATTINNVPVTTEPYISLPDQEVGFNIDVKNLGTEAINNYKIIVPIPYNASYVAGSATGTVLFSPLPTPNNVYFDATLGATGSIVWDFGTLPLPANPSTLLAKLSFKLKTTTDCTILLNTTCGSPIYVNANSNGVGATTGIRFTGTKAIKGYSQNGSCVGQPLPETLSIKINGAAYVAANCLNTPLIRNFSYCSASSTIGTTEIASNFPPGSTFYNEFPVTVNSIQYSDSNPIPLVAGSTITYYALPPNTTGCSFPFTISKCKLIDAINDNIGSINGTTGNTNVGNVLTSNGNGPDTLGGVAVTISQVNLTVVTPAASINGGPVPSVNPATGQISVPAGTPAGTYTITYQICEKAAPTNCDTAIVTITCPAPVINAVNDTISGGNGTTGNPNAGNVLTSNGNGPDTLNGVPVTIGQVNLTVVTPAVAINGGPVPTVNTTTGQIAIPVGTPAGTYTITYQICEKLNPTNCDTAVVTITVTAPVIDAVNDTYSNINCTSSSLIGNIFTNDTLNGVAFASNLVNFTLLTGSNQNISIDNAGNINVTSGIAKGTYTLTYKICEKLNPTNCDNATIIITVQDTTPPSIATLPATTTISCPSTPVFAEAIASDTCGPVTLTFNDVTTPGACAGSYSVTRTWTATDASNNTTTSSQIIIVEDTTAPVIGALPSVSTIDCPATPVFAVATATDNCGSTVTLTFDDVNNPGSCIGTYSVTRTWTATDACGNVSNASQTINVQDLTPPTITDQATNIIVECDGQGNQTAITDWLTNHGGATANDTCSEVTWTNDFNALANDCSAAVTVVFTAKDACGNASTTSATFSIQDITAPVAPEAPATITVACASDVPAADSLTATDNCTGTITAQAVDTTTPGSCPNSFIVTRTWTFTDACNNSSSVSQTINVIDTVAPVIAELPATSSVACPATPVFAVATATDNCGSTVTLTFDDVNNPGSCIGTYSVTRTWTATDACGNVSNASQTINVQDATAPVIDQLPAPSTIACPATPVFDQATATDNCGAVATLTFVDVNTPGNNSSYTIVRTWTATDACGNASTASQSITVNDTQAPVGPTLNTVTGECSVTVTPPVGNDNCAGQITATTTTASLTFSTQGTYVITWLFSDGNGNSYSDNQTVIVHDTTAPVTPVLADITAQCTVVVPTPTTTDVCAGTITGTPDGPLAYNAPGTYIIHWTFDDGNGNSITATQNVIVSPEDTKHFTSLDANCNNDNVVFFNLNNYLSPLLVPTGGTWSTTDTQVSIVGGSIFKPYLVPVGDHLFTYTLTNQDGCQTTVELIMTVDDDCPILPTCSDLVIHNAFSPNGDTKNEIFLIEQIDQTECYPTNTVEIYNRWGVLVYETKQYDNASRVFRGTSEGRATVAKSSELPTGTYFYIIDYTDARASDGTIVNGHEEGYLYLSR